ncbi:sensor histidine kinase [Brumimicrobium mesophilum]|uniref:sensor histidine kinase n=1 Tax=Brumimicrobium mesophilum TaxID=392717 RepID=UPI00131B0F5C|nr:histidine kinase [Brumimicrobium mesophilum]
MEGFLVVNFTMGEEEVKLLIEEWKSLFFGQFLFVVLVTGLNYSFNQFKHFMEQEKELETVKRKALEMEINILKNQLSPHFTFNVLNNLQFLIIKDKDEALAMLSRYSKILQYYVYESQKKYITLEREIMFLKEYFDLEINRHRSDLAVNCHWGIIENNFQITPFILSAFVENSFKHVQPNSNNEFFVSQSLVVTQDSNLVFILRNSYDENITSKRPNGVGLEHVKERLKLLYPNNFKMVIQQENEIYSVQLELNLKQL